MLKYKIFLFFISVGFTQTTTIAVIDFDNNGLEPYEVKQLSQRLESEFVKIGEYNVVERSKIDQILKEQKFQISGCVDECLIEVGEMLGANEIVLGSVGIMGNIHTVSAKLVDATSGEILRTADFDTNKGIGNLLTIGMKEIALKLNECYSITNEGMAVGYCKLWCDNPIPQVVFEMIYEKSTTYINEDEIGDRNDIEYHHKMLLDLRKETPRLPLPIGYFKIRVSKDGYKTFRKRILITHCKTTNLNIVLTPEE